MVFVEYADKEDMKLFFFAILILSFGLTSFAQDRERTLNDAVIEYQKLQVQIDRMLKEKRPDCSSTIGCSDSQKNPVCSVKAICERPELNKDGPLMYKNSAGEILYSDNYFSSRDALNSCLKDKYADEISAKKNEMLQNLGARHLQKIFLANKKLSELTNKYNQGSAIQKISMEVLNMSLQAGLSGEGTDWDKAGTSKDDLHAMIAVAEKKLKLKLIPEIKNQLVEIQYLKKNPTYQAEVDKFDRALVADIIPSDPLYDWSKLTDEESAGGAKAIHQNRDLLMKKTQDAYGLFKETSKDIVDYLESKKTKDNSAMMDRLIERVKTIRFEPPRLTDTLKKHCTYPNAFYSPRTHSLTICPQMLGQPKMALLETLAHEISHSFDSCNFSGEFYKKRGPTLTEEAPFEMDIKMDPSAGNYQVSMGDDVPGARVQDKIKYADHPFSKTMSCLQDERSVGAVVLNEKAVMDIADKALVELRQNGQDKPNNPKASYLHFLKDNGKNYFDYFQGCDLSNNGGEALLRSQMQEAFADKMSSEIIARKLSSRSRSEAESGVIEIALSYGDLCGNEGDSLKMVRDFAAKEGCKNFYENKTYEERVLKGVALAAPEFDSHPKTETRVGRNLLAHPLLRKALNCPSDRGVKYCE